ncbi:MAG: RNA polymerase sigma-54 factor, partial [Devosia sp.]|nr:RNA polymerase sigma-54 factor [Devosia sp.]
MALSPRLEVRQGQSLTLTPQLMQSIRLLQLSHLELNAFVEAELLRNPLLEREDAEPGESDAVEPAERPVELNAAEDTVDFSERIQSADSIADGYDTAVENVFPEQDSTDRRADAQPWSERGGGDGEPADIDQFVAARLSLGDHLAAQAGLIIADPAERLIAQFLIDSLNEAGYLAVELDTVATQLGAPLELVEAVLGKLQTLDPVGVFARDVRECLALQLREKDRLDPLMQRLLDHLELIAGHDMARLMRYVGVDREDLADMLAASRQP